MRTTIANLNPDFFFTDNETTPVANIEVAERLQRMIGDFLYGDDDALSREWPVYGINETFLNITVSGFEVDVMYEGQLRRCDMINRAFANAQNGI